MIEIRHLKLIKTIAEVGSLQKAARELHVSPSALSHQLRQLEERLGVRLFVRTPNRLVFTSAGQEFRDRADQLLDDVDGLYDRMQALQQSNKAAYIHGYSTMETNRLYDQADSTATFLHWDSYWPNGTTILEAGCGVGAQTRYIAAQNPDCQFVAVDLVEAQLVEARRLTAAQSLSNVRFQQADLMNLPYARDTFDHVFVCFVLEHLADPKGVLRELWSVLRPGGSITVIEGDHGSTYFYPDSEAARRAVAAQVALQEQGGGDANIGRKLYPLLQATDYESIVVSPRQIYVDDSKPALVDGFILKTFTAMIAGVAETAIAEGAIAPDTMKQGLADLKRTAAGGGTFSYTFFKAIGLKPEAQ